MMTIPFIDLQTQYQQLKQPIDEGILRVLAHGQYIMGPEIAQLETELAAFTGSRHAIAVSDGSTALLIALLALDIGVGDEVITTPFTFIATAEMIALAGATPVFVDIDPTTYNLDPAQLAAAITPRTKAIMPVSLYGQCADMIAINRIAAEYGLPVIEDAAQSFGASQFGQMSCNLTTVATTSFFPSKPLGCYGDGGACFTNDAALAAKMRSIRLHGQEQRYHHPRLGLNGRMDTIQAAVLLAKLPGFRAELAARAEIGAYYNQHLASVVCVPATAPGNSHIYAQYTIEVAERDLLQQRLTQAGIPTAVHYPCPLHLQPVFAGLGLATGAFPHAEAAAGRVLSLPMHPYLQRSCQDQIISTFEQLYR